MTRSIRMPKLRIGDLESPLPIVQGGMGVGISLSGLAAAVANAGGIGVISSTGLGLLYPRRGMKYPDANKAAVRYEIRNAKRRSKGVLGLNLLHAATDFDDVIKIAFDERIHIVFIGAGLPVKRPKNLSMEYLTRMETKVFPIVSSARAAELIMKTWAKNFSRVPDGFVIEGPLAGGHLGFKKNELGNARITLERILLETLPIVRGYEIEFGTKIPLIAAGGIFTGADIYKMLGLGADGVQLGTRFVATEECDASPDFKKKYVECSKKDIAIIQSPLGLPGRAIRNSFLRSVEKGGKRPDECPYKCLRTCDIRNAPYCIATALMNARKGNLDDGFAFCGQNAYKIKRIMPVGQLMKELRTEFAIKASSGGTLPSPE